MCKYDKPYNYCIVCESTENTKIVETNNEFIIFDCICGLTWKRPLRCKKKMIG